MLDKDPPMLGRLQGVISSLCCGPWLPDNRSGGKTLVRIEIRRRVYVRIHYPIAIVRTFGYCRGDAGFGNPAWNILG